MGQRGARFSEELGARVRERKETHSDGKDGGHPEQVVDIVTHSEDLGDDGALGPLDSKHLCQLPQVDRRGLPNRKDWVPKPSHAEVGELVVKELDAELLGEERDVLDDGLSHAPLLVFGELDDGGKEGLGEELDADDCFKSGGSVILGSEGKRVVPHQR